MSRPDMGLSRHRSTSRDWEKFRSELEFLYVQQKYTLSQVREHMQDIYGFQASPRQYQERFRQWKSRKYVTGAVREDMKSKQAHGELVLDPDVKRRLERQIKAHPERKLPSTSNSNSESSILISTPSSSSVSQSGTSILGVEGTIEPLYEEATTTDSGSSPGLPMVTVTNEDGGIQMWPFGSNQPTETYNLPHRMNASDAFMTDLPSRQLSISPPLPRTRTMSDNAEAIFFHLRQFCQYHTSKPPSSNADTEASSTVSSAVVQRNTNDLKNIIYLYKIGNCSRADMSLQNYCNQPFEMVIEESIDFLRQIITTLAPINTTRRPAVRHRLLKHLHDLAKAKLGPWHPFTVICKHFRQDEDSLEISMRALQVLQNSVMIWSRLISFRTELDLIAIMRREWNLDNALLKALLLIDTSALVFGPDSLPTRKAQFELSCIYIAQQNYGSAIDVCRKTKPDQHRDMLAVHIMENIAEAHRLLSQLEQSRIWLETAADLVVKVEGKSVATTHVLDKMFDTLAAAGGSDISQKLQLYTEKYRDYL